MAMRLKLLKMSKVRLSVFPSDSTITLGLNSEKKCDLCHIFGKGLEWYTNETTSQKISRVGLSVRPSVCLSVGLEIR